jgi:hypothetical protein
MGGYLDNAMGLFRFRIGLTTRFAPATTSGAQFSQFNAIDIDIVVYKSLFLRHYTFEISIVIS